MKTNRDPLLNRASPVTVKLPFKTNKQTNSNNKRNKDKQTEKVLGWDEIYKNFNDFE